jgi:hypothetical protein
MDQLSAEQISEYCSIHRLFQDQSKERPLKVPKTHGSQPLSCDTEGSGSAIPNMADEVEFYPSSAEDSELEDVEPKFQAFLPYKSVIMFGTLTRPWICRTLAFLDSC